MSSSQHLVRLAAEDPKAFNEALILDPLIAYHKTAGGEYPVHLAAGAGHWQLVERLVQLYEARWKGLPEDLPFNLGDDHGLTALHHGVKGKHAYVVTYLLACVEMDVSHLDRRGLSAFAHAVLSEDEAVVCAFLESRRSLDLHLEYVVDRRHRTIESIASDSGSALIRFWLGHASKDATHTALGQRVISDASRSDLRDLGFLHDVAPMVTPFNYVGVPGGGGEKGGEVLGVGSKTITPESVCALHIAILDNNMDLLELLLSFDEVDLNTPDQNGCTPVIVATNTGHARVLKRVVEFEGRAGYGHSRRARLDERNHRGESALDIAIEKVHLGCALILLDHAERAGITTSHEAANMRSALEERIPQLREGGKVDEDLATKVLSRLRALSTQLPDFRGLMGEEPAESGAAGSGSKQDARSTYRPALPLRPSHGEHPTGKAARALPPSVSVRHAPGDDLIVDLRPAMKVVELSSDEEMEELDISEQDLEGERPALPPLFGRRSDPTRAGESSEELSEEDEPESEDDTHTCIGVMEEIIKKGLSTKQKSLLLSFVIGKARPPGHEVYLSPHSKKAERLEPAVGKSEVHMNALMILCVRFLRERGLLRRGAKSFFAKNFPHYVVIEGVSLKSSEDYLRSIIVPALMDGEGMSGDLDLPGGAVSWCNARIAEEFEGAEKVKG
ncbi:MAG: ankyrin repeat domain-containing protein [Candidatus Saccharimonadales bacterium]